MCGKNTAIEMRQARQAFHSRYYAKRRKRRAQALSHKGPQVGRLGSVEEAMLDNEFPEFLNRLESNPSKRRRNEFWNQWGEKIIVLIGLVYVGLVWWFDIDFELAEGLFFYGSIVVVVMWLLLSQKGYLGIDWQRYHRKRTWVCTRCQHHWVLEKKRKDVNAD